MSYFTFKVDLAKNKKDILDFWKANFPDWPESKYYWFYENNPYGRAICYAVIDTDNGSVVGSSAVFPRRFSVQGKLLTGGIVGDFGVNKNHRILGPALKLQKNIICLSKEKQIDFLYGFPNKHSKPVQKKIGYKILGSANRLSKIFKSYDYIKKYINIPIITKIVSLAVDLLLTVLSKESYCKRNERFCIEVITDFDKRFDDLWSKALPNYTIIGERTSQFLNWRFAQCPYMKHKVFTLTLKKTSEIIGYIIYYINANSVHIVDLFATNTNEALETLILEFSLFQKDEGVATISFTFLGNDLIIKKLKKYGFCSRDTERKIIIFIDKQSPYSSCLLDKDNWYVMEGDNDI